MPLDPLAFDLNGVRVRNPRGPAGSGSGLSDSNSDPFRRFVVCPFTIVVSSNEVAHAMDYTFGGMVGGKGEAIVVPTVSRHLKTGDYALDGLENRCCVERKQLEDIFMCCGTDRVRFLAEVERMAEMEFSCVVIEADWREIMNPQEYRPGWQSEMNPRSVEGTIIAWMQRYKNIHWQLCGDRRGAEERTFSILRKFWEESVRNRE